MSAARLREISEDSTIKDVETTEFKLKQVRELTEEIDKTKPRVENLQTTTNTMLENSEPNFSSVLNGKLENISYKWNSIVDGAKTLGDKYEIALKKNDEVSFTKKFCQQFKLFKLIKICLQIFRQSTVSKTLTIGSIISNPKFPSRAK